MVRYQPAKHPTLGELPWVLGRPGNAGVAGFLIWYPQSLRDERVNSRDGLVLWQAGAKIVWNVFGSRSAPTLIARRADGRASFRIALRKTAEGFVSAPRFPSIGCWRLVVRSGAAEARVIARVVAAPRKLGCDATRVESGNAFARPRSSGIRGGWGPWRTAKNGALIYTHGHYDGMNMKVPWWVRGNGGPSLRLAGTRLDGAGSFIQEFPMALSPKGVFPSIIDVPAAGCWLLTLRTGLRAGVLVVRAIDAP
jgi:hypothetical protein